MSEQIVLFPWTDDLKTGVNLIDEQHKVLVDLLNNLYAAMMSGDAEQEKKMRKIFDDLVEYTVYHFKLEEQIMADHKVPDLEEHKQIHIAFIAKVNEVSDKFLNGDKSFKFEITKFLKHWLTEHIMGTDKLYMKNVLAAGYRNSDSTYRNQLRGSNSSSIEERAKKPWWKFW